MEFSLILTFTTWKIQIKWGLRRFDPVRWHLWAQGRIEGNMFCYGSEGRLVETTLDSSNLQLHDKRWTMSKYRAYTPSSAKDDPTYARESWSKGDCRSLRYLLIPFTPKVLRTTLTGSGSGGPFIGNQHDLHCWFRIASGNNILPTRHRSMGSKDQR